MKKRILTSEGYLTLTVEEAFKHYEGLLHDFATDCSETLCTIEENYYEFEDYMQMGLETVMETFRDYSVDKNVCYSTYLCKSLRYKKIHIIRDLNRQKRKPVQPSFSLNEVFGGMDNSERLTGDSVVYSNYFEDQPNDLEQFLMEKLTEDEIAFFIMAMKKRLGDSKGRARIELQHTIDSLEKLTAKNTETKETLAKEVGISRPTLNKRVEATYKKVQELAYQYIQLYL